MTEGNKVAHWSLKGRMLRWLGATSAIGALALSATGAWFVSTAASRQLDALLQEELDEVRAVFPFTEQDAQAFEKIAGELDALHPASRFAWRVWKPDGDLLLGEFGVTEHLRRDVPAREPLDQTVQAEGGARWRTTRLPTGHVVGLVVEEAPHFVVVRTYGMVAVVFVLVAFAAIYLVGRSLALRMSRSLSSIAARAREVHAPTDHLGMQRADLPDEIREVVEALELMLRNIRGEMENSRMLIAGLAHELRSPIQNLLGESEVALLAEREPERYRELLGNHLDELRELRDAVQNLVALCSAPRSVEALSLEEFDLLDEIHFRLGGELKRAGRLGVATRIRASGEFTIRGDRQALLTAIRNVVSNAIDWTEEGGQVRIDFDGDEEELVVTVADSGPGIAEELREKIFEPFFRGPHAAGRRVGYGLGLALVRSAVTAQGGAVSVEEAAEGGALFRLRLPRSRVSAEA